MKTAVASLTVKAFALCRELTIDCCEVSAFRGDDERAFFESNDINSNAFRWRTEKCVKILEELPLDLSQTRSLSAVP